MWCYLFGLCIKIPNPILNQVRQNTPYSRVNSKGIKDIFNISKKKLEISYKANLPSEVCNNIGMSCITLDF